MRARTDSLEKIWVMNILKTRSNGVLSNRTIYSACGTLGAASTHCTANPQSNASTP
jgi:hypothetical protein